MKSGKKGSQVAINARGGDYNHLQPRQAGRMQHPAAEDLQAQDSFFSDMRQIGFNKIGGGYFAVRDLALPQSGMAGPS